MTVNEVVGNILSLVEKTGVEYSGVLHVSPERFREMTGVVADFSRPSRSGAGDNPVSVVYMVHPLTGCYHRSDDLVSYTGPYTMRGPLGGVHVSVAEPVVFVVTR